MAIIFGTAGNDVLLGTAGNDTFDLSQGGQDTATGLGGDDQFLFDAAFDAGDQIDGGTGTNDRIFLNGDYSVNLTLAATTITGIEALVVTGGYSYNLTTDDANVAAGETLIVNGGSLGVGDSLLFDGSAELDGNFNMTGGAGDDTLGGGSGNDIFSLSGGGIDTVYGGGGDDVANFGASFSAADSIDGGIGDDTVILKGDYSAGVTFGPSTLTNVETLSLVGGFSYNFTSDDATVGAGETLTVNGGATVALVFDGSAETDGDFSLVGGAGDDNLTGGRHDDKFRLANGGDDRASGQRGADIFQLGAALTAADRLNGQGGDNDTAFLSGDYSGGVTFGANTMRSIETLIVRDGYNYNLTTHDNTVDTGRQLHVDASLLGSAYSLTFNGSAETDGHLFVTGGNGVDSIIGGGIADTFTMNDDLTAADQIDGGGGSDTVILAGDYSAGLTLGATTILNVEAITLTGGNSYTLTTDDATVGAGNSLTVVASTLGAADTLVFDGSAETDGRFSIFAGAGSNTITTGAGNDSLNFGANFKASDQVDGDGGTDILILNGDYSAGVTFGATTLVNVENIRLAAGNSYSLTTDDATVAAGGTLQVIGITLGAGDGLTFDGSAETDGRFVIRGGSGPNSETGGAGDDILYGGSDNDNLTGGLGKDRLFSDAGSDTFTYAGAAESTSTTYDIADAFDAATDVFDLSWSVTAVDPTIASGKLSSNAFDADLATAANGTTLGAFHAVLFTPTTGGLAGHTFLVVDANGVAGYQAGADLVVDLTNASNLGSLSTGNFI